MPTRYIKRSTDLDGGQASRENANAIFVDSDDDQLKFTTGASGTTTVDVVTESQTQTLTNKTLTAPTITNASIQSVTPVDVTTATVSITAATHGGRTITLNRATGITATLPAATGSGVYFRFVVGTTFTGAAIIQVANATDVINGNATLYADSGDTVVGFTATASDDSIDLFNTDNTTGGLLGEIIELVDVASGKWHCNITANAGGTEVTPFANVVS